MSTQAVGYVRVSTAEQASEGVSLDMQEDRLRAYCRMAGLDLVALIREEGVSASAPIGKRPGGAELLALLAAGKAGHVVALKLDRLFRNAVDALNTASTWDKAGVALHLVDMGGQTLNTGSAMGKMFFTLTAAFAELERNLIAERTRQALHHKAGKGEAVSRAARGLRIEAGRLVPDPASEGFRLAVRARELRAEGLTLAAVAEQLTAEGFRPARPGAGEKIAPATVAYMIRNPRLAALAGA